MTKEQRLEKLKNTFTEDSLLIWWEETESGSNMVTDIDFEKGVAYSTKGDGIVVEMPLDELLDKWTDEEWENIDKEDEEI